MFYSNANEELKFAEKKSHELENAYFYSGCHMFKI